MWNPGKKVITTRLKPLVHALALLPLAFIVYGVFAHTLGSNPVEAMTHITGEWSLRFLLLTLCISPLIKSTRLKWMMQFRRMLGLYSAFYVLLHFLIYWVFDQSLSLGLVIEDIYERPYITVGFAGFLLLIPLAISSTMAIRRRLGRRWNSLHRLTYVVGGLAIVHLLWITKADFGEAWVYGLIFGGLMLYRLPFRRLQWSRIAARS